MFVEATVLQGDYIDNSYTFKLLVLVVCEKENKTNDLRT